MRLDTVSSQHKHIYLLLLIALFLFFSPPSFSQFERIGVEHGLSSSRVYDILQDSNGFLWFATLHGLNRFDGNQFLSFAHEDTSAHSLSGNIITALGEGEGGVLFAGTVDGVVNVQTELTGEFSSVTLSPGMDGTTSSTMIREIFRAGNGDVYVSTVGAGLTVLAPPLYAPLKSFTHDPADKQSLLSNSVYSVREDSTGRLWIGTLGGLQVLDPETHFIHHVEFGKARIDDALESGVTAIDVDSDRTLWIGTSSGLIELPYPYSNPRLCNISTPEHGNTFVTSLLALDAAVWVGTGGGLCRIQKSTGEILRFVHDPGDPSTISDNLIYRIATDKSGNVWVATGNGVSKYLTLREQFHLIPVPSESPVTALLKDPSGGLWIGTEKGLNFWQRSKSGNSHPGFLEKVPSHGRITSLASGPAGSVLVGTGDGRLVQVSRLARSQFSTEVLGRVPGIMSLLSDSSSTIWIGTSRHGLRLFDRRTGRVRSAVSDGRDQGALTRNYITAMVHGQGGSLWVGTEGAGLVRIDEANRPWDDTTATSPTVTRFVHRENDELTLSNNRIYAIHLDRDGNAWVGTGAGLDRIDGKNGAISRTLVSGGEFSGMVYAISEDAEGILWLATIENGVYAFDPRTGLLRSYSTREGLPTDKYGMGSAGSGSGEIFFGSKDGLVRFEPRAVRTDYHCTGLSLTEFRILDRPYPFLWGNVSPVNLEYTQNFLSFTFAALGYPDQERTVISYKLEGSDKQWFRLEPDRSVSYRPIEPGDYVLRAKSFHPVSGKWDGEMAIPIHIAPPFWATWWFRTLLGVAVLGLAIGVHRYRLARALELEKMRIQIASDLHDDIGSSLGSIALSCDMMSGRNDVQLEDRSSLQNIAHIARGTAEHLRDIVWVINPSNDDVHTFMTQLKRQAATLMQGIRWTGKFEGSPEDMKLEMEFRHHAYLMFKEILHNIVKHSAASEVEIEISAKEGRLMMKVTDNGRGFDSTQPAEGVGLKSLRERARKIGGELTIRSGFGEGTSVHLAARIT